MVKEDLAKAKAAFDTAIRRDPHHYNGWWGLGNVFVYQHRLEDALQCFSKAQSINNQHPVLLSSVVQVLINQSRYDVALQMLNAGFDMATPNNQQNYKRVYQKAMIHLKTAQYSSAIRMLLILERIVPLEWKTQLYLAECYGNLGRSGLAVRHLSKAIELQPEECSLLKQLQTKITGMSKAEISI
jgi:anaphase-promoting complex subunit 3